MCMNVTREACWCNVLLHSSAIYILPNLHFMVDIRQHVLYSRSVYRVLSVNQFRAYERVYTCVCAYVCARVCVYMCV